MTTLTFSPNWIHTPAGFAPTGNTGRLSVSPDVRLSAPERAVADQLLADLDSYPLTVAYLDGVYRAAVAARGGPLPRPHGHAGVSRCCGHRAPCRPEATQGGTRIGWAGVEVPG